MKFRHLIGVVGAICAFFLTVVFLRLQTNDLQSAPGQSTTHRGGDGIELIPSVIDLGTIGDRGKVDRYVVIRNRRASDVLVERASTSCGCVLVDSEFPLELSPEESHRLSVSLAIGEEDTGAISKSFIIFAEDAVGRQLQARGSIVGFIPNDEPVTVSTEFVDFGQFGSWEHPRRDFSITLPIEQSSAHVELTAPETMELLSLTAHDDGGRVRSYRVAVTDKVRPGNFGGRMTIDCDGKRAKASIELRGRKMAGPFATRAVISIDPREIAVTKEVTIAHPFEESFARASIRCVEKALRPRIDRAIELRPGLTKLLITLVLPDGFQAENGELLVSSDKDNWTDAVKVIWLAK